MDDSLSLKDSLAILLAQVPAPIHTFIATELGSTAKRLTDSYRLHIDQGDVLYTQLLLLLLGQVDPSDFSASLQAAGVSPESTRNIVSEVNETVFKRLREEERVGSVSSAQQIAYRTPPARVDVPVMQVPQPISSVAVDSSQHTGINLMEAYAAPAPEEIPPAPKQNPAPLSVPHPWQTSPARSFQTASVPYTSTPYASQAIPQQGYTPPTPTPDIGKMSPSPTPEPIADYTPTTPPPQQIPTPGIQYNLDPYREPIE